MVRGANIIDRGPDGFYSDYPVYIQRPRDHYADTVVPLIFVLNADYRYRRYNIAPLTLDDIRHFRIRFLDLNGTINSDDILEFLLLRFPEFPISTPIYLQLIEISIAYMNAYNNYLDELDSLYNPPTYTIPPPYASE